MKKLLLIIIILLIFSCISKTKKEVQKVEINKKNKVSEKIIYSLISKEKGVKKTTNCNCELKKYNKNYSADLTFQNSEYSKIKNDSLFLKWSHSSLKNQVKSIHFSGFDTIPNKYSIFKNVNRLSISSRKGIYGIDIFKNLKTVHFFGSVINLDTKENG